VGLPRLDVILREKKLPGLDGFRMIAVLAVVLSHAGIGSFFSARHGVAGFFVLSGFLITLLLLREYEKTESVSLRNFYVRRALRIFPAYYIFIAVSISWDIFRGNENIREMIVPSIFYFVNYQNALSGHSNSSVAHLWSLAVEEQFYIIWPLIFLGLMGIGRKYALAFLCFSVLLVMFWRTYAFVVLNWGVSYAYNAFDTRFDNLAIGCLLAFLTQNKNFSRSLNWLSSSFWMPLITLGCLSASLSVDNNTYAYGPAFTIDAILLSLLLVQLIRLSNGTFWSWLNHPVSVYLGILSYPIYLWHVWGIQAGRKLEFLPEIFQTIMGLIFSVMIAAISYHFLEKKFLRLKSRFSIVELPKGSGKDLENDPISRDAQSPVRNGS
jgi:peptidoglycan/LPS O-acetylase OafA/YrhL